MRPPSVLLLTAVILSAVGSVGCDPDAGPRREWTPADHDPPENAAPDQVAALDPAADDGKADAQLITQAWRKNCQLCHGPTGRGDGPQGPMLQAPDLTRKEWLDQAKDDEIEKVIRAGKNKMPPFGHLPDGVIKGLVKRVRAGGLAH